MSTFDVSTIEFDDTVDITIPHPKTDDPFLVDVEVDDGQGGMKAVKKPMSITAYAPSTKEFRAAEAANQKRINGRIRNGKLKETPQEQTERVARFLADCTVSLNNFNYKGGDPTDRESSYAMFLDPKSGWITQPYNRELADWGNAMKSGQDN